MSHYQQTIRETMARLGRVGAADPRHIEAYMRLEHSTLDGLSPRQFDDEVEIGIACVEADGTANAESLAQSFAL